MPTTENQLSAHCWMPAPDHRIPLEGHNGPIVEGPDFWAALRSGESLPYGLGDAAAWMVDDLLLHPPGVLQAPCVFVPVPGPVGYRDPGHRYPYFAGETIADCMAETQSDHAYAQIFRRTTSVPSDQPLSRWAHLRTTQLLWPDRLLAALTPASHVILVTDVITHGGCISGCAEALQTILGQAGQSNPIFGLAAGYTVLDEVDAPRQRFVVRWPDAEFASRTPEGEWAAR